MLYANLFLDLVSQQPLPFPLALNQTEKERWKKNTHFQKAVFPHILSTSNNPRDFGLLKGIFDKAKYTVYFLKHSFSS